MNLLQICLGASFSEAAARPATRKDALKIETTLEE
jgi:hypothetical protein